MDKKKHGQNDPTQDDEYLWDGSGAPDAEIQKLEGLLAKYRHDGRPLVVPVVVPQRPWWLGGRLIPVVAAAAVLVIAVAAILLRQKPQVVAEGGWEVSNVAGSPRIGRKNINAKERLRLGVGQVLETDAHSSASLEAEAVGEVDIDPSTRLRLLTMNSGLKRIALDRGTIHAHIWAPPGQFVVDTPSAMTVDLGCAYTLQVDDAGAGIVRTSLGWVGFKLNGRESFIPAGAACSTRPLVGPGTPYFEDASAEFRTALARFDFEDKTADARAQDLAVVLAQARKRDALTLWHLLSRVDDEQRVRVYERLETLAPAPAGVTRDGILRLDQTMLDAWWNALGFDDISIWRQFEHSWSDAAAPTHQK
jgi:hypothetical protein